MLSQVFASSMVAPINSVCSLQTDSVMTNEANTAMCLEMSMTADCSNNDCDNKHCDCCDLTCTSVHCFNVYPFNKTDFTWLLQNAQIIGYLDVTLSQTTSLLYRPPIT
jgi:hypothetical protein